MVRLTHVLALTGLALAFEFEGKDIPVGVQEDLLPRGVANFPPLLENRQSSCEVGEKVCDSNYCISITNTCCGDGNGASCKAGYVCQSNGCCPAGKTCTGTATCDVGKKKCGDFCIPSTGICCGDDAGTYCNVGQTCTSDGRCRTGSGSGTSVSSSSTSTSTRSTALAASATLLASSTRTSSSSSSTTTTALPTSIGSSTLCKRKKGGSSHSSGGGSDDDDCNAAGTLSAPSVIAGLFLLVPVFFL
ncbi:unnamed protein product [Clonostachys rosea]|uniref:GPI anchored protein n=1 Tax=Bionectria ochroleuca TaxID=29856 RepID=A0ABY6ULR5_BIOOC|nr:unnamed protein product [Clonostachys rosea]